MAKKRLVKQGVSTALAHRNDFGADIQNQLQNEKLDNDLRRQAQQDARFWADKINIGETSNKFDAGQLQNHVGDVSQEIGKMFIENPDLDQSITGQLALQSKFKQLEQNEAVRRSARVEKAWEDTLSDYNNGDGVMDDIDFLRLQDEYNRYTNFEGVPEDNIEYSYFKQPEFDLNDVVDAATGAVEAKVSTKVVNGVIISELTVPDEERLAVRNSIYSKPAYKKQIDERFYNTSLDEQALFNNSPIEWLDSMVSSRLPTGEAFKGQKGRDRSRDFDANDFTVNAFNTDIRSGGAFGLTPDGRQKYNPRIINLLDTKLKQVDGGKQRVLNKNSQNGTTTRVMFGVGDDRQTLDLEGDVIIHSSNSGDWGTADNLIADGDFEYFLPILTNEIRELAKTKNVSIREVDDGVWVRRTGKVSTPLTSEMIRRYNNIEGTKTLSSKEEAELLETTERIKAEKRTPAQIIANTVERTDPKTKKKLRISPLTGDVFNENFEKVKTLSIKQLNAIGISKGSSQAALSSGQVTELVADLVNSSTGFLVSDDDESDLVIDLLSIKSSEDWSVVNAAFKGKTGRSLEDMIIDELDDDDDDNNNRSDVINHLKDIGVEISQ